MGLASGVALLHDTGGGADERDHSRAFDGSDWLPDTMGSELVRCPWVMAPPLRSDGAVALFVHGPPRPGCGCGCSLLSV